MNDTGAIHAIGNGSFLIYGRGADIISILGPDYTSPCFGQILCGEAAHTQRIAATNRWQHTLRRGDAVTVFDDVMDPQENVFIRRVQADFACELTVNTAEQALILSRAAEGMTEYILPAGIPNFHTDTSRCERRLVLIAAGCVSLSADGRRIAIAPGAGSLTLLAAKPAQLEKTLAFAAGGADIAARDAAFWQAFLARGAAVRARIPQQHPEYARVMAALENVPIQICAQQSADGGVMAGHFYPLGYVRDQAGVLRGLLAMGYTEEARRILEFRYAKWKRYGDMTNAEAMGNEEARLYFSNDEVEIPAYVVLGVFDYLRATGDTAFAERLFDMVIWALQVQIKHLCRGMTGFSGDETYIAGHIFPRPFLYHGSAESTFLFIEGALLALEFDASRGLMTPQQHEEIAAAAAEAKALYRENFVEDGILYSNAPIRETLAPGPRFHYGWCQADELNGTPGHLTWLERGADGIYRCPHCLGVPVALPCAADKRFRLGSVSLQLAYFHTTLFTKEEIARCIAPCVEHFVSTGRVSSEPGRERALGYDPGLLLYNMAFLGNRELSDRLLTLMLDLLDERGMWAEYYDGDEPFNCRCRPWESAINMEGMLFALLGE